MKNLRAMALLLLLCMALSCKKELNTANAVTATNNNSEEATAAVRNPFGLYVISSASDQTLANTTNPAAQYELKYSNKILLAQDYGVKYMRMQVYEDKWTDDVFRKGFLYNFTNVNAAGIKVLLNVMANPIDGQAHPFPDATAFANMLKDILDTLNVLHLKPEVIVVENEESNSLYHVIDNTSQSTIYASMQKYVDQLSAAATVCKTYLWWNGTLGVKVTNGGFTTRSITYDTWYWMYYTKKDTAGARVYAQNAVTPSAYKNIYQSLKFNNRPPDYIMSQINTDSFLRVKYAPIGLSYTNIHWYEPAKARGWNETTEGGTPWSKGISNDSTSKGVLESSLAFFKARFTPKVISNEVGQITTSSNITKEMCDKITSATNGVFYYACWMDADGNSAYDKKALHNTFMNAGVDSYTLRPSGTIFKQKNAARN